MGSISGKRRNAGLRWALALVVAPVMASAHDHARAGVKDLYVVEALLNQVQVVRTNGAGIPSTLGTVIPVGNIASQARTTPDGSAVWVVNAGDSTVTSINTYSKLATTFSIGSPNADYPSFLTFSPNGSKAYIVDAGTNQVAIVDVYHKTVVKTIPVGNLPAEIAITPDGSKLYVANLGDNTVSVIDSAQQKVVATVTIPCNGPNNCQPTTGNNPIDYSPPSPEGVRVSPDGRFVYVTDAYNYNIGSSTGIYQPVQPGQVTIIRTSDNHIVKTIANSGGFTPADVGFSLDGSKAFVVNGGNDNFPDNRIGVIDTASQTLTKVITETAPATGASEVDPDNCDNVIYIPNFGTGSGGESVVTINAATQKVASVFALPAASFAQTLAVVPVGP